MSVRDVLLINSYGGSILAACMDARVPIRASMETNGYGIEVQRFNAPKLRFFEQTKDWPRQNLSKTLVIGHPPCSAFSGQNTAMRRKQQENDAASISSPAFQCTRDLLDHAMTNDAAMIMVESVPRAAEEAAAIHEDYAKRFGYSLFRILQHASSFGLCQNRKRFWAIFAKERGRSFEIAKPAGVAPKLRDVIKREGVPFENQVKLMTSFVERMKDKMDDTLIKAMFEGEYGFGKLRKVLAKQYDEQWAKQHVLHNRFDTGNPTMLDPDELAPVIVKDSLWLLDGKLLTLSDYFRVMGYPDWYKFPERVAKSSDKALGYLSRGVCPPIVSWLMSQFAPELGARYEAVGGKIVLEDGLIVDLTDSKKTKPAASRSEGRQPKIKKDDGVNDAAPELVEFNDEEVFA